MDYYSNNQDTITNLKNKNNNHLSYKKVNYNHFFPQNRDCEYKCKCNCHKNLYLNEIKNYNSEINTLDYNEYNKLNNYKIKNRSTNNLLSSLNKGTNYNYNSTDINKENKDLKNYTNLNNKLLRNKKLNIIKTESNDNLAKSFVIYKNEIQPLNTTQINRKENSPNKNQKKYFYGGDKLKIANNTNNHSYKEIIDKAGSKDKIFKKSRVINFTENNINYDCIKNIHKISQNYETDINYELRNDKNNCINNDNNGVNKNKKEIKKSSSENYLLQYINNNQNNKNLNNNFNYDYKKEENKNDNLNEENKHQNKGNKFTYNMNNDLCFNKNDYLLNFCSEKNLQDGYITHKNINEINLIKNNLKAPNNFRYYYNNKKNNIVKNRNLPKSNSIDNFKFFRYYKSFITCKSNDNLMDDFNYEDFKLRVKLGLLKKQIYRNEINNQNKNRINTDFYYQDKKNLLKVLNNKRQNFVIENILLEKTKKLLEEKKSKKNNKISNKRKKLNQKDENKILSSIKKNLINNNKKNNNKYVINPKLNFFKC